MEQGSSPSDLTTPRFITGERDILVSVRVFSVYSRSSSVKRNIGFVCFLLVLPPFIVTLHNRGMRTEKKFKSWALHVI